MSVWRRAARRGLVFIRWPCAPRRHLRSTPCSARFPTGRAALTRMRWVSATVGAELSQSAFAITRTKLCAPPAQGLVPRARLLERLDQPPRPKLVVVMAPAGYGKSTLLAQWA